MTQTGSEQDMIQLPTTVRHRIQVLYMLAGAAGAIGLLFGAVLLSIPTSPITPSWSASAAKAVGNQYVQIQRGLGTKSGAQPGKVVSRAIAPSPVAVPKSLAGLWDLPLVVGILDIHRNGTAVISWMCGAKHCSAAVTITKAGSHWLTGRATSGSLPFQAGTKVWFERNPLGGYSLVNRHADPLPAYRSKSSRSSSSV